MSLPVLDNFVVVNHPLVTNKISMLRNKNTGNKEFREIVDEISTLICYEATRDVQLSSTNIDTPLGKADVFITDRKFGVVPILRAGIGMTNGILRFIPNAKVGHIGLYRDPETLNPVEYYCKLPVDIEDSLVFLTDPMLATGGTASAALKFLKDRNVKDIKLLCLIATPEGIKRVHSEHPEVVIYAAACDEKLNDHGYIIPGLGDAGDRLFGTK